MNITIAITTLLLFVTTATAGEKLPKELEGRFQLDTYDCTLIPGQPPISHLPAEGSKDEMEVDPNGRGRRIYTHTRDGKTCQGERTLQLEVSKNGAVKFMAGPTTWSGDLEASSLCGGQTEADQWTATSYTDLGWAIEFRFEGKCPSQTFARTPRDASSESEAPFWFEETR